ncbi:hypothetical protein C5B99_18160 [Pseudoclavibacter sp. Z016]|nr:hypothetical protein C5B99_18160 [Pseudoclavibacter sp. Z016]
MRLWRGRGRGVPVPGGSAARRLGGSVTPWLGGSVPPWLGGSVPAQERLVRGFRDADGFLGCT